MPTAQQTELEAVNSILAAAGERAVTSLGSVDSSAAELLLDDANREIQVEGWYWNRRNRTFSVSSGKIPIGAEVVKIDTGRSDTRYAIREETNVRRLFDLVNGTFDFTADITLCVVELLAWDNLPHTAQQAMQRRAAAMYLEANAGDMQLAQLWQRRADMAHAELMREEIDHTNARIYDHASRRVIDRVHPLDRWA